jgi:hypothetical protein
MIAASAGAVAAFRRRPEIAVEALAPLTPAQRQVFVDTLLAYERETAEHDGDADDQADDQGTSPASSG